MRFHTSPLLGQKPIVYAPTKHWSFFYKSTDLWFTNFARVLPTSRARYYASKPINSAVLSRNNVSSNQQLKYWFIAFYNCFKTNSVHSASPSLIKCIQTEVLVLSPLNNSRTLKTYDSANISGKWARPFKLKPVIEGPEQVFQRILILWEQMGVQFGEHVQFRQTIIRTFISIG